MIKTLSKISFVLLAGLTFNAFAAFYSPPGYPPVAPAQQAQSSAALSAIKAHANNEITIANAAMQKTRNPAVKSLAAQSKVMHQNIVANTNRLASKYKLNPNLITPETTAIENAGMNDAKVVFNAKGMDADRAYVNHFATNGMKANNMLAAKVNDPNREVAAQAQKAQGSLQVLANRAKTIRTQ